MEITKDEHFHKSYSRAALENTVRNKQSSSNGCSSSIERAWLRFGNIIGVFVVLSVIAIVLLSLPHFVYWPKKELRDGTSVQMRVGRKPRTYRRSYDGYLRDFAITMMLRRAERW